jgi:hypothetical protein
MCDSPPQSAPLQFTRAIVFVLTMPAIIHARPSQFLPALHRSPLPGYLERIFMLLIQASI